MASFNFIIFCLIFIYKNFALRNPNFEDLPRYVAVDYDAYSFNTTDDSKLYNYHITGKYRSTKRNYSAYVANFPASKFSFYPSDNNGCKKLIETSNSSVTPPHDCEYATNGGFFEFSGKGSLCLGNLISDGKVWQLPTDGSGTNKANFGLTRDGKAFIGFLDAKIYSTHHFTQLITGVGWIVRKGQSYVNKSQDLSGGFITEKAPRTSVGIFKDGSMALVEIDGEEDIKSGPDLFEIAELLVQLGVDSAINIDGGGSSVSVKNGAVISKPTCHDTPEICERAVASITCVRRKILNS
uniref:Phosphodiester glycosidase domain-containing protein n=1 Tax=Acrobeloides nanus TaxID=290746 RepID=A0A914DSK5_9BILA